jgi:BirA family biotin operon repressor/biotin-[acetyl-CoA-carboxylase] ligase
VRCAPQFTLAAAVAVAEALSGLGFPVGIKWPNDVLASAGPLKGRKLCGIRCEMELAGAALDWVSIGIGINVNQEAFPDSLAGTAASLLQLGGGKALSRTLVACAVLDKLEDVCAALEREGFAPVRQRWLGLALGMGEQATVRDDGMAASSRACTGIVRGLDEEGHLLLELPGQDSLHTVLAGDLIFEV